MITVLQMLCAYGIMFSITSAKLLSVPRSFIKSRSNFISELLDCSFCSGFWSGMVMHLLFNLPLSLSAVLVSGFSSAAFCYVLDTLVLYLEPKN